MPHPVIVAFRRIRRAERALDIYLAAGDAERADQIAAILQAVSDAFERLPASSKR